MISSDIMQIYICYIIYNIMLCLKGYKNMENKIDSYRIFESVARNESISKASEELYISQPAVSQAIKRLEDGVGGQLFIRTKNGVMLTTEGNVFYQYIKKGLEFIDNGEKVFSSLKNIETGIIRIGASTTITKNLLLPYLKQFHEKYPNIDIEIVNELSSNLVYMLKNGLLDVLVINTPIKNSAELDVFPFTTVQDVFCCAPKYMDTEKVYTFEDLKKYKLIAQKMPSNTRAFFEDFLKHNNQSLEPSIEAVSFSVVEDLTKIGFGYACLTKEYIKKDLEAGGLVEIKTNIAIPSRNVCLAIKKNSALSFACNKLINIMINKSEK